MKAEICVVIQFLSHRRPSASPL